MTTEQESGLHDGLAQSKWARPEDDFEMETVDAGDGADRPQDVPTKPS